VSGVEGRYAMALYNSANKQNVLTKVDTDLKALKKLVETDKSVRSFLETPILNIAQKKTGVRKRAYSRSVRNRRIRIDQLVRSGVLYPTCPHSWPPL